MRISVFEMYGKEFVLDIGDTIEVMINDKGKIYSVYYFPVSHRNKSLCPYNPYSMYANRRKIEVIKKYSKEIGKIDNFSEIERKVINQNSIKVIYRVDEVDEVDLTKNLGELWSVSVSVGGLSSDKLFDINTSEVTKRTPKQIAVKRSIQGKNLWQKDDIGRVFSHSNVGYYMMVIDMPEGVKDFSIFEEAKDKLIKLLKDKVNNDFESAQNNLKQLTKLSEKEGY